MSRLPWYLKSSPIVFSIVALFKFSEVWFAAVGAHMWASEHEGSPDAGLLVSLKVIDVAISAFAWVAAAIIAKLLLVVIDRVGQNHA